MRLRQPSVDAPDGDSSVEVPYAINGSELSVAPGMELPRRCVQCGDAMDLLAIKTIRGKIGYSLCREHAVWTCGKLSAGLILIAISAYCIGSKVMGDPVTSSGGLKFSVLLGLAGAAMTYWALPVRTGKRVDGHHRLSSVHPEVIAELPRLSR